MALRDFFRLDDAHPFTGRHMLAVVLAFFGVVIAVNFVMAFAATGTFPGLVVENSYVASQEYNGLLAKARQQAEAGWRMDMTAPRGVIDVRLAGHDGNAARGLSVTAFAARPSSTHDDRMIVLPATGDAYRAAEALPAGQWEVDVEARRDGDIVFRELRRIFVMPDKAG
jgi:nitrogen fixation protein FixH